MKTFFKSVLMAVDQSLFQGLVVFALDVDVLRRQQKSTRHQKREQKHTQHLRFEGSHGYASQHLIVKSAFP